MLIKHQISLLMGLCFVFASAEPLLRNCGAANSARIAFVSTRGGNPDIYVMDSDGKHRSTVTTHDADDTQPTWSPDGRYIAYIGNWDIVSWNIHVIDSDGKNQRILTKKGWDQDPTWSPDSESIAFSGTDRVGPLWGIYIVDVGSGAVKMTGIADTTPHVASFWGNRAKAARDLQCASTLSRPPVPVNGIRISFPCVRIKKAPVLRAFAGSRGPFSVAFPDVRQLA